MAAGPRLGFFSEGGAVMSTKLLNLHSPGHSWYKQPGTVNIYRSSLYPVTASVLRRKIRGRGWVLKLTEFKFNFGFFWLELHLYEDPRIQPAVFVFPFNGDGYLVLNGKDEIPCVDPKILYTICVLEHLTGS